MLGSVALREFLVGAVIAVMYSTGQALERALADELDDRLMRHEQLEETTIYPALAAAIGGQDPMAVMSGSHREIFHLVRLLRRNITRLDDAGPLPEQVRDIRRILYGLHAILALHFAQEEELYATVVDPRPAESAPA